MSLAHEFVSTLSCCDVKRIVQAVFAVRRDAERRALLNGPKTVVLP